MKIRQRKLPVSTKFILLLLQPLRLDIFGHLGWTPATMLEPPLEHLVERYFHPDNMSSAEKLKIELTMVRDQFKMSESDCGSARVQDKRNSSLTVTDLCNV